MAFVYDSSLMGADYWPYRARRGDQAELGKPFRFGEETALIEMPISWSLDDYPHFEFVRTPTTVLPGLQSARTVMETWRDEFRYMQQTVEWGVLTYTMHPYVIGRGYRMLALAGLVQDLAAAGAVFMTMADAAAEAQTRMFSSDRFERRRASLCPPPATGRPLKPRPERHIIVDARRPVGHMHRPRLEIDEHGADRHGALRLRLARIGMPADRKRRAEVVGGGRTHVREGQSAAMLLQQVPHAIDAVERVGRDFLQQRFPWPADRKWLEWVMMPSSGWR